VTAMRNSKGYLRPARVLVFLLAAAVLAGVAAFALRCQGGQESVRAQSPAPVILVTEPLSGTSAYAGSYLPVSATAMGFRPITRVELWLDGHLVDTQDPDQPEGVSSFLAHFELLVSEGPHMLFVRAVDADSIVGQSLPVSIVGAPKPGPGDVFYAVTVGPDETLTDIAESYGTDLATLLKLNAGPGGQEPAPGSLIKVPVPPENEPPASPPPTPVPGGSSVPVPDAPALIVGSTSSLAFQAATLPVAPDSLQAQVKDCKVTLVWNDNATDEGGYTVWMAEQGLLPETVGTLEPSASTGPAWFEFQAPDPGYFSFWVEAVNSVGAQPSNVVWAEVDSTCPATQSTQLQVEAVDMTVGADYDRVYCYVSVEGAPEVRVPEDDSTFMQVQAGQANIAGWQKLALPTPADNSLNLEGECWGWSGGALNKLGNFSGNLSSETWDGAKQTLDAGPFQIGVTVESLGAVETREISADRSPGLPPGGDSSGTFFVEYTEDPTLPVPYDLGFGPPPDSPWFKGCEPRCDDLLWKWDGDQGKITGFMVFVNGLPYGTYPYPSMRDVVVRVPMSTCDSATRWQVATVAGPVRSKLSDPLDVPPECEVWVKVKFEYLDLTWTHDGVGSGSPGDCDTMDAYYATNLQAGGPDFQHEQTVTFYGYGGINPSVPTGQFVQHLGCGVHSFKELADSIDPVFVYGVPPALPPFSEIRFGTGWWGGPFSIWVRANFVDSDGRWSGDDWIARYNLRFDFDSPQEAIDYLKCGKTFVESEEDEEGGSHLQFTLTASTSYEGLAGCP
jgi:hypothetical protein